MTPTEITEIITNVAESNGFTYDDLMGSSKNREIAALRFICYKRLFKPDSEYTKTWIGKLFNCEQSFKNGIDGIKCTDRFSKCSDEIIMQIQKLFDGSKTYKEISVIVGVSVSTVKKYVDLKFKG